MKTFCIAWIAFAALGTTVQAELTSSNIRSPSGPSSFPGRWIQACEWLGRNNDDDNNDNEDDQCQGPTVCNEQHQFIASVLAYNNNGCECNVCGDRLTVQCDYCTACGAFEGKDSCVDAGTTFAFTDFKNGTYSLTNGATSVTTSGKNSANNHVLFEATLKSNTFYWSLFNESTTNVDANDDFYFSMNGVRCNSLSFDNLGCIILDCRNVATEYYWTCSDAQNVVFDTSHPLHGFFASSFYCPNNSARAVDDVLSEGLLLPFLKFNHE